MSTLVEAPGVVTRAEFEALRVRLEALEARVLPGARLRHLDRDLLAALRATIERGVGFTVSELYAHAAVSAALREALEAAGLATDPHRLGRRLGKLARAGVLLDLGRDGDGRIWALP